MPHRPTRAHSLIRCAAGNSLSVLVIAALGLLVACSSNADPSGAPSSSPTDTHGPALSPVPSDTPINIARADQLFYEGAFEEALSIYSAAAINGTEEEQRQGLFAMAKIQSRRGENSAAERNLEALREKDPSPSVARAALLLQGKAEFGQGDFDEAREAFEEYIDLAGPATPYALLYLAQIERQQDHAPEAIAYLDEALLADLPNAQKYEAYTAMGQIHDEAGDKTSAIAGYRLAADFAPNSADESETLWALALVADSAGEAATANATLRELIVEFPAGEKALQALDHPRVAGTGLITDRERAYVLFRNFYNTQAEVAYQAISDAGGPGAAEAQYYLGVLSERYERYDDAVVHYDGAINALPPGTNDSVRAQATWDKATVLERLLRTDEAIATYGAVADVLPTHDEAANGVFKAGLLSYQINRPGDAFNYWTRFLQVAPDAEETSRANYWLAKASKQLGDTAGATAYYQAAVSGDPFDFYGLRAQAVLSGETEFPETGTVEPPEPDWFRVETWLETWAGLEDRVAGRQTLFTGPAWLRAEELLAAGLDDRADDEFAAILDMHADNPWILYRLIRAVNNHGRPWVSSPAAYPLLFEPGAPSEILQLVYPLEFLNVAQEESDANGFSPLLLLALVRQESLYDPGAVSSAEAMGLTQVIPSTADGIAAELEVEDFRYTDLFRPRVSLRFGAHYLGGLLEGFGGVIPVALSGYNGGPGNAGYWWELGGGDVDLFVESIEFPETRAYVELVMENYARYLYAYGYWEAPSLPL